MKNFLTKAAMLAGLALVPLAAAPQENPLPAPEPQTVGKLTYLTGGVGLEERDEMHAKMGDYNLRLTFAAGDAYLGRVKVRVADQKGHQLLATESNGPWFFVKLPKGKYKVSAENEGESQARTVDLSKKAVADVVFRWKLMEAKN